MLYVDPDGNTLGYEDVLSKIAVCRKHYAEIGLGAGYVETFIRWPTAAVPSAGRPRRA